MNPAAPALSIDLLSFASLSAVADHGLGDAG